ncbi:MAG: HNH endonuclease [Polyangiaceae bacterium]|nr:HNH endonuclease [Polyangiaceae bacterium]
MVRAKLFKGLCQGTMKLGTLFADVLEMPRGRCVYCGATPPPKLHGDHLIPRHRGGAESGDNLVWACRSCNSSKSARDVLEWYALRNAFPPLLLVRRYLKLAIADALAQGCIDAPLTNIPSVTFSIKHIPLYYPLPTATNERSLTCENGNCSAFADFYCDYPLEEGDLNPKWCGAAFCGDHAYGPDLAFCFEHGGLPTASSSDEDDHDGR